VIKAAKNGDLVMVLSLIFPSTWPSNCNCFPFFFRSYACQLKDLHLQGFSLLSIDSTGQTALHYGAKYGHKDIVRYLISYAPNSIINMIDNDR
jgi:ankyrin repeat protein